MDENTRKYRLVKNNKISLSVVKKHHKSFGAIGRRSVTDHSDHEV